MNFIASIQNNKPKIYIIIICAVVMLLSTKGITDENIISMQGDMPKYLMNGAFFHDLMRDLSFADPLGYAYKYFAKYPALSLGHHPLLLGVAEVPFYSVFGISVFSGRLTIVCFMLLAAIVWFLFIKLVYNETVALFSSLLFVTMPYVVEFSRVVMSEIPTLALLITTVYFFYRYCESDNKKFIFLSAGFLVLSMYSKHIAVFMIPVFFFFLIIKKGVKGLIRKDVVISCVISGLLLLPLVIITFKFSRANIDFVSAALSSEPSSLAKPLSNRFFYYLNALWQKHLTLPALFLSVISIPALIWRKDGKTIIFFLWMLCPLLLSTYLGWKDSRYAIYWIPVFCLFAALTFNFFQTLSWRAACSILLIAVIAYQFVLSFRTQPDFTYGYEEAAKYIVDTEAGENILYSGIIDTGYFIFFVRKHLSGRDRIILRADKILATSKMNWVIDNRIINRDEIYELLRNYGVRYVVIEDIQSRSRSLEWLRQEVKSDKFTLRKSITLKSSYHKTDGVPLSIYEFKEYTLPKEGQTLRMNIPLMGNFIELPFSDLLRQ